MRRLIATTATILLVSISTSQAKPLNLTLCGASPGGLWSLVGAGVDASVKAAYPGSVITYQTSSGGPANVLQVKSGKCELGMANDGDLIFAIEGKPPFKSPVSGLKAVAVLYNWTPVMWIARRDFLAKYGIKDLGDLVNKKPPVRLAFNRRGLLTSAMTDSTLKALGVTPKDIESWGGSVQYQASNEQAQLMKDGRIDLLANTLFEGHRSIAEMAQSVDLAMLDLPERAITPVIKEFGLKPWTIKAGTHPWQKIDAHTVTTSVILFVDEKMDEQTVYDITKAMIQHPEGMGAVSEAMKRFKPPVMIEQSAAPFAEGAIRAYKEAGLMK
ncbi:MAG: TAXI family TRAP transporter solute-binding subunit [Pseudolabrys sp.]|nr:TAXI family TRAP transporter solute-binding subunit [Pseudolabrys sp.]MDP2295448.1 TAXI family TRAP transporter solute-binding subunit [Pseudolabrys sp.]